MSDLQPGDDVLVRGEVRDECVRIDGTRTHALIHVQGDEPEGRSFRYAKEDMITFAAFRQFIAAVEKMCETQNAYGHRLGCSGVQSVTPSGALVHVIEADCNCGRIALGDALAALPQALRETT